MTSKPNPGSVLEYQRSNFAVQLPTDCLYTPSHAWLARGTGNRWRVGLTKFATRMLGEMVDHDFQVGGGAAVEVGQAIGWIEGFKAVSDLYCVVRGQFQGGNPALKEHIGLVNEDPHGAGWLYEVSGEPDSQCRDVQAYRDWLDQAIDRLLAQREAR